MTMLQFFESICLNDGVFERLSLHEARIKRTLAAHFPASSTPKLAALLHENDFPLKGRFKCRLSYGPGFERPVFVPYHKKSIRSLRIVEAGNLDYSFKRTNRNAIETLMLQRGNCDDILMIKNGFLTDTSYCNIVLKTKKGKWVTPSAPLLAGTQREHLLNQGIIISSPISLINLSEFVSFKLINAMIDWDEADELPVETIDIT